MIIFLRSLIYSSELLSAMGIESYPFGSNPKNSAVGQEYNRAILLASLKTFRLDRREQGRRKLPGKLSDGSLRSGPIPPLLCSFPSPLSLAICLERLVEGDAALRDAPVQRQAKEDLRRHSLQHQSGHVLKAEFHVVLRMAHQTAASRAHIFQP